MSKFQLALLVVFGVFIVIAVILFSQSRGSSSSAVNVSVWGSLPQYEFSRLLESSLLTQDDSVKYLAVGIAPDLIILPQEDLLREKSKLMLIPSESLKSADFVNTFIKHGEMFQTSLGTYALPFYIDPMVLYWNRDLLAKYGFSRAPMYWDEIYDYVSKINIKDGAGNITQTTIALGEARNIPHAKDILSLLMLQAGTPITAYQGERLRSTLLEGIGTAQIPSVAALEFYTQFANPQKSFYTWNRSQTVAQTHFTSGKSAMYLGFASELPTLKAKNPTMDIGVSPVPQSRTSNKSLTISRLYGLAVSRSSKDGAGALTAALKLISKGVSESLTTATSFVPTRRDVLADKPSDPAQFTFYSVALQSTGWHDPDPSGTEKAFVELIESVTSGRARIEEALRTANNTINALADTN
jgi:ABC-type glycerol-3-phosphate transport system substrate-binding protein